VLPVLGRAWGAVAGEGWTVPDVSPGQVPYAKRTRLACLLDFSVPSRIRTCAHGSGEHSAYNRYQRKRSLIGSLGAHMSRANRRPQIRPSAAIDSMIQKAIRCTIDHTCMSRNLSMAVTPGKRSPGWPVPPRHGRGLRLRRR